MNYLQPSEYELYGLEATTAVAWVTAASAMIDAHCRRITLAINQYTERLRTETDKGRCNLPICRCLPWRRQHRRWFRREAGMRRRGGASWNTRRTCGTSLSRLEFRERGWT